MNGVVKVNVVDNEVTVSFADESSSTIRMSFEISIVVVVVLWNGTIRMVKEDSKVDDEDDDMVVLDEDDDDADRWIWIS